LGPRMAIMQEDRELLAQGLVLFIAMADGDRLFEQDMLDLGWKRTPDADDCRTQGAYELVV
jgi:hypothetical protein